MKKFAFILALVMILGSAFWGCDKAETDTTGQAGESLGNTVRTEDINQEDVITTEITGSSSAKLNTEEETEDNFKKYESVLTLYKMLLIDNDQIDVESLEQQSHKDFFLDLYNLSVNIDAQKAGYAFKDLNNDNIDELILLDKDGILFAAFTLKFGKPIAIDYNNFRGGIDSNWYIYKESLSKGNSWGFKIIQLLENGELDCIEFGIHDPGIDSIAATAFLYRNGKKELIDEETVKELYEQYSQHISYLTPTDLIAKLDLDFIAC